MLDTLGINDRFNNLCEERGITDQELAEILGYNYQTIRTWRTGEKRLRTIEALDSICEEFGCTRDWLVYGKDATQKEANRKAKKKVKAYLERIAEETIKLDKEMME